MPDESDELALRRQRIGPSRALVGKAKISRTGRR
jgi:hypothetical protein